MRYILKIESWYVFLALFIVSLAEVTLPFIPYINLFKYMLLAVAVPLSFSLPTIVSIFTFFCLIILAILYFFIGDGYSLSLHFLLLQCLLLLFLQKLDSFNISVIRKILDYILKFVCLVASFKITLAILITFFPFYDLTYSLYTLYGGGSIAIGNYNIPRLTFGPEFVFLVAFFISQKRYQNHVLIISLMIGMSRIYLLLLAILLLIKRRFLIFFMAFFIASFVLIFSDFSEQREVLDTDVRFIQWSIFYEILSNNPLFGKFGDYISQINIILGSDGYDSLKSECESCQLVCDFGLIPLLIIIIFPFFGLRAIGTFAFKFTSIFTMYVLLFAAAAFNPVFTTTAYLVMVLAFMSYLKISILEIPK